MRFYFILPCLAFLSGSYYDWIYFSIFFICTRFTREVCCAAFYQYASRNSHHLR